MIRICLFHFALLAQLATINTEGCDSFNNVTVTASENENAYYTGYSSYVVNGCLEREAFKGKEIREVIVNSGITRLGKDSVRNLPQLERLAILENGLEILEPQAFRNVPSLEAVMIQKTNLREIPKDVFNLVPTIRILNLINNKIDFIASGAFSNMDSLESIHLLNNQLTYWKIEWFENCPNLNYIDFSNNKISIIPRGAFASLPTLRAIYLGLNKITTIRPDAFRNLENLESLYLGQNRLTVLDERAFPNKIYIKQLAINNNRLNYLPGKLLVKLSVGRIFMDQNPWKCPCMQRIHDWLLFTSGSVQQWPHICTTPYDPVCVVPRSNTCQETVEKELTRTYLGHMRNLTKSLGEECTILFS